MFFLKGINEFYEGWLACVLGQPLDPDRSEAWRMGWDTGNVPGSAGILPDEIRLRHIIVVVPTPNGICNDPTVPYERW